MTDRTFREQNLSPLEELALRLRAVQPPEKLADHQIALLMQKQQFVTVRGCEMRLEFNGIPRVYTHVDSLTCQPAYEGKKFLVSYSLDFPEAIFVLTHAGAYVETVPLKGVVKWFDAVALNASISDKQTRLNRARAALEQLHAGDTTAKEQRLTRNVQQVEAAQRQKLVVTFDPPASTPAQADDADPVRETAPANFPGCHPELVEGSSALPRFDTADLTQSTPPGRGTEPAAPDLASTPHYNGVDVPARPICPTARLSDALTTARQGKARREQQLAAAPQRRQRFRNVCATAAVEQNPAAAQSKPSTGHNRMMAALAARSDTLNQHNQPTQ